MVMGAPSAEEGDLKNGLPIDQFDASNCGRLVMILNATTVALDVEASHQKHPDDNCVMIICSMCSLTLNKYGFLPGDALQAARQDLAMFSPFVSSASLDNWQVIGGPPQTMRSDDVQ